MGHSGAMKILEVIAIFQKAAGTSVFCAEVAGRLNRIVGMEAVIAVPNRLAEGMYTPDANTRLVSLKEAMESGERWDVVHIHGVWSPVLHKVTQWARRAGIPIVWSPHGMLRKRALRMKGLKKFVALGLYQWWDLRKAAMIHVCSGMEKRDVERLRIGVPFWQVPLGVEVGAPELIANKREKRVLYIGRINRGKGLANLVRAWAKVRATGWKVEIVGFDEEGCEAELKRVVKQLGMEKEFYFPGPIYGAEKVEKIATSSILILPSFSENFGSVVIEALAQKTPVIATKETPWEELEERKCGWWVELGVEPLARALAEATSLSGEEQQVMGERGRKLVEEKYTWDSVAKKMIEGYKKVLSARAGDGAEVTKDVEAGMVVGGNPATVIKPRC